MEIISFVGNDTRRNYGRQFEMPKINLSKLNAKKVLGAATKHLSFSLSKLWIVLWLGGTIFLSAIIPYYICSEITFNESFADPVRLDPINKELAVIDSLMEQYALENEEHSYDENGNLILGDGSVLSVQVDINQPVTYQTYKVKSGESISTITRKFGLSNISTLIAINNIDNARGLREGQKIKIPSMDGLVHHVAKNESLTSISAKYHVSVEELCDVNELVTQELKIGQEIFIPGARLDATSLKKAMGELFANPISASYRLTSKFGKRADPFTGVASSHTGIDMACPTGTPITASMAGKVVYSGWSNVFGNYVILNHGNGYQTLYGHMSKITCKTGQTVNQGTKIGLVGSTGYSTGPHLHFTVYKNGKLVDPLSLIKR